MSLSTLTAIGKKYGDYLILPLTLKECAEIKPDTAILLESWPFVVGDKKKVEVFNKWLTRKVRDVKGEPVTVKNLEDTDYPAPWLTGMMTELLFTSGFPLPKGESE